MILWTIVFVFWMIFGSFISVLVYRIKHQEKGIFLWRSKCPSCNHTLNWLDLVPFFSYLFLWWKCRYCKTKISVIYPLLELITWLTFLFMSYLVLWSLNLQVWIDNINFLIYACLVSVFIVAIAFYDILFYEISYILVSILWLLLLVPQFLWIIWNWKLALELWLIWFLWFMWIIYLRWKIRKIEWMWGWDAIWAILIWFITPIIINLLHLQNYPSWLVFYIILLLWFLSAGIVWVISIWLWKLKNTKSMLPFLPFMFLWVVLFVFVWKYILNWIVG